MASSEIDTETARPFRMTWRAAQLFKKGLRHGIHLGSARRRSIRRSAAAMRKQQAT